MTSPNNQSWMNALRLLDREEIHSYFVKHFDPQATYCLHFGCGKVLTMTEQLYGSLCHEHNIKPKDDITKHLSL